MFSSRIILVSSHFFNSPFVCPVICFQIREFRGHTARVLHLAKSPDGATILSASADETLRFWQIFRESSSRLSGSGRLSTSSSRRSSAGSAGGGGGAAAGALLSEDSDGLFGGPSGPAAGGGRAASLGLYSGMSIR
jgi:hypothetical protein